ncbi:MAG: ABC transporter ATP-binding protein, partial [Salegentibacter mishustinae]|nr:ABC transporter ATP-binding protein [Salegentibacter mishustinae]
KVILYPEEIKLSKTSGIKATVKKSWFKGETWLIEASLNGKTVYFNHSQELKEGKKINLKVSKKLIESRLK